MNSRPLEYVGDDINFNIILTADHFLTLNPKSSIPDDSEDDTEGPEFLPKISSGEKFLQTWNKNRNMLMPFGKLGELNIHQVQKKKKQHKN